MKRAELGSLSPGHVVGGRFRIDRFLGRGGMGEVYAATHVATGARRALKVVREPGAASQDDIARFLREARAATAIDHPNVIRVHDVFADDVGLPVIVMELLHGESLAELLARVRTLSFHEAAVIFADIARGVHAAHERGIVHRDLKPQNVFLARDAAESLRVKVLDFGVAKVLDPEKLGVVTYGASTRRSHLIGTPEYMAFEQAMSEADIDGRADTWSYGVMLIEALTGRRPLMYTNLGQMFMAFLQESVPPARTLVPDLPGDVHALIDACLQKMRDGRLADLSRAAEVLSRHVHGGEPVPQPPAASQPPAPQRRATWAAWGLFAAIAISAVTLGRLTGSGREARGTAQVQAVLRSGSALPADTAGSTPRELAAHVPLPRVDGRAEVSEPQPAHERVQGSDKPAPQARRTKRTTRPPSPKLEPARPAVEAQVPPEPTMRRGIISELPP